MLSIAEYQDSSEESDNDDSDVGQVTVARPNSGTGPANTSQTLTAKIRDGADAVGAPEITGESFPAKRTSLFANLPAPKSKLSSVVPADLLLEPEDRVFPVKKFLDSDDEISGPKKGAVPESTSQGKPFKSVKITVPSLSEFDDDDVEATVKKPRMSSGSSLFDCLPPPKNSVTKTTNRLLLPHTLSKKLAPPVASRPKPTATPKQTPQGAPLSSGTAKSVIDSAYDDSDEDMEGPVDFFSLDKVGKDVESGSVGEANAHELFDVLTRSQSETTVTATPPTDDDSSGGAGSYDVPSGSSDPGTYYDQVPSVSDPQALLQDAGFLRLRGKKRGNEDIQIIDVSQDDQLPNPEEWMAKSLTEETSYRPSRKNGAMPTTQQRRKHQITYLAFQAKEREMELKNQWAQNRQTKYQTQSKYGF